MTNLQWLATMSREGARDTLSTGCPYRRPVDGNCGQCAYYDKPTRCDATQDALSALRDWLLEEKKLEDCP